MGVELEILSTASLQRSLDQIVDPNVRKVIEVLATKAMLRAKYFCASMLDIAKYGHYALNTPLSRTSPAPFVAAPISSSIINLHPSWCLAVRVSVTLTH